MSDEHLSRDGTVHGAVLDRHSGQWTDASFDLSSDALGVRAVGVTHATECWIPLHHITQVDELLDPGSGDDTTIQVDHSNGEILVARLPGPFVGVVDRSLHRPCALHARGGRPQHDRGGPRRHPDVCT